MAYKLRYSKNADKQLDKMDPRAARIIVKWLDTNVNNSVNPRSVGKPLKGKLSGYWRYRIGTYRAICIIKDRELIVIAISIADRSDIYTNMKNQV